MDREGFEGRRRELGRALTRGSFLKLGGAGLAGAALLGVAGCGGQRQGAQQGGGEQEGGGGPGQPAR